MNSEVHNIYLDIYSTKKFYKCDAGVCFVFYPIHKWENRDLERADWHSEWCSGNSTDAARELMFLITYPCDFS